MLEDKIIIRGARVHNLKNIDLEIPHNKLVVFTGVSGSGKSSLAFDTIFAEGQRRYIESLSPYARQFLGQMKPADVDEIIGLAPAISIDQKALSHNPRSTVGTLTEIYDYLRVLYARLGEVFCPVCGRKIAKMSVEEMIDLIISKSQEQKVDNIKILTPVVIDRKGEYYQLLYDYLALGYSEARIDGKYYSLREKINLARHKKHSIDIVIDNVRVSDETRLFESIENALSYSRGLAAIVFKENDTKNNSDEILLSANWTCPNEGYSFPEVEPRLFSFNSPHGACPECHGLGRKEKWLLKSEIEGKDEEEDESTNKYEHIVEHCEVCDGKRLNPNALSVRIDNKNIAEVCALSLDKAHQFFSDYYNKMTERQKQIAETVVFEISARLDFLLKVGLNYLTIDREAETLSGGEAQRIRLSSQIGSHLSHTLYVLDEPTIGLHERDTERLIESLKSLRDQNNSVIIVEHDERTIMASDYLVDLGPLAGRHGGEVTAIGETKKLLKGEDFPNSLTLQYLRGEKKIDLDRTRRTKEAESIKIIGANINNLKNINVDFPLRKFVAVTGVSGSGKSTLLYDALYENLIKVKHGFRKDLQGVAKIIGTEYINKVVIVNQSPIGRTPRSNPATYTGIFTPIRDFYASLPASRERGYGIGRFSFNRAGGRCESCDGAGFNLIEMHFLPAVLVECEVCRGKRFNRETLQVKYKNKNISEVLALTIDEAIPFFDGQYLITDKLKVLAEVGLGYLQLGQSATTLSGGEAQRIKLARELTHTLGQKTLYLLDEPSVGLHYHDIEMLLTTLNKLIDRGNSVILIEHNMHIIKEADYVIDLGPEGGDAGGKVVAKGSPEDIVRSKESLTGKYLNDYLK
ncbi:MAG: excinuclease ABC subunit UvrA [Candidatus Buchananbacteria bacterium]|jgi:excinuclease ABC subunit A